MVVKPTLVRFPVPPTSRLKLCKTTLAVPGHWEAAAGALEPNVTELDDTNFGPIA